MKKKFLIIFLSLIGVVCLAVALVGCLYYSDNVRGNFRNDCTFYVYPGMSVQEVTDSIDARAGIISRRSLERAFARQDVASSLKPGRYSLSHSSPSIYAARMLSFGWQTAQQMTLSGTLRTREKIARQISNQMLVSYTEVLDSLNNESFLARYGTDPVNLFGMILPDTYEIWWTASMDDIFDRLKKEYDNFWTSDRVRKARAQGLTPQQASTLASIVAGETRQAAEFPVIAGVYLNRLHSGMKLQADPTICFIFNYELTRVLKKHLEYDSPYNTYMYAGLPPGPINCPSKPCLEAVLNPARHDYIFFCASSAFDGTHKFASSYSEHLENARDFQRALSARQASKK